MCRYCRQSTRLVAFALPPDHELLDPDGSGEDDPTAECTWSTAARAAFIFYIEYLPVAVQRRVKEFSHSFRRDYSVATMGFYWANHCEGCGSVLDDHDLFCEPEAAFVPLSKARAEGIHLVRVDDAMVAATAGYAYDPPYFHAMPTA
jgi:hypothetical protein